MIYKCFYLYTVFLQILNWLSKCLWSKCLNGFYMYWIPSKLYHQLLFPCIYFTFLQVCSQRSGNISTWERFFTKFLPVCIFLYFLDVHIFRIRQLVMELICKIFVYCLTLNVNSSMLTAWDYWYWTTHQWFIGPTDPRNSYMPKQMSFSYLINSFDITFELSFLKDVVGFNFVRL